MTTAKNRNPPGYRSEYQRAQVTLRVHPKILEAVRTQAAQKQITHEALLAGLLGVRLPPRPANGHAKKSTAAKPRS
jgi:hypothetical protein